MPIDENELNRMKITIIELKQVKGPKVVGTDKQEEFDKLIQQAEYHHWQLSQANKCASLLDEYYAYRAAANKSSNRRLWLTYLGFFFAYFVVIFCYLRYASNKGADITEYWEMLGASSIVALVIASIHLFVNYYIFDHIDLSGTKDLALVFLGFMMFYLIVFIGIAVAKSPINADYESLIDGLEHIIIFSGIASVFHIWINHSIVYSLKKKDEDAYKKKKKIEDEIRCVSRTIAADTSQIRESVRTWRENIYSCIDKITKL